MTTALDISYVAATAIATVYVVIAISVAASRHHDVLTVMAGDAFAYAMATALAAVILGRLLRADSVTVSTLIYAAVPFGATATAFHALARRKTTSRRLGAALQLAALTTAAGFPLAMGIAGWY